MNDTTEENDYIIEARDIVYKYKENKKPSMNHVSIGIKRGVKTILLGANGAGKSTLFYHFNGVFKPDSGKVLYNGSLISYRKKGLKALRSDVAVVLQNPDDQIFCATVEEDIAFGPKNLGLSEEEVCKRVDEALFQTGMIQIRKKGTLKLSYGQRKRLAFAGAIAMKPKVLIMDEPTAGLDPQMSHELMELADQLHHTGTTVVISTHDVDLAYAWADEIHVLRKGVMIYSGVSEEFYSDSIQVSMSGLMLPSIYCINKNLEDMRKGNECPYPRTMTQLVSKMAPNGNKVGSLFIIPVNKNLEQSVMDNAMDVSGHIHVGVFGTSSRKAVFDNKLATDFVYNGLENCMMDNILGKNSILCYDVDMKDLIISAVDRLKDFGIEVRVVEIPNES